MARVTIEDCLAVISNRFELSVLASFRAKQIARGSLSNMNKDNDKSPVIALREIADNCHDLNSLRKSYVYSLRKNVVSEDVLEEETTFVETRPKTISDIEVEDEDNDEDQDDDIISIERYDFDGDE